MKTPPLLLALLLGGLALARAQEAVVPGVPAQNGAPQPPQARDTMLAPIPPTPMPSPAPVVPQAPLKKGTAEELRQAVRIRELKTLVGEDPAVIQQKATAQCAKTEAGRCVAMRNYYTLLYTKIGTLDPSLRPVLETQLCGILVRYEQSNIRPTVLIEPIAALPGSRSADHAPTAAKAR
jgi:hypothetical protein